MKNILRSLSFAWLVLILIGCKPEVKERDDEIYSRHLQRHVKLSIISTAIAGNKDEMNLLLFNGAETMKTLELRKMVDSLYNAGKILPLTIVAVDAKSASEYGLAAQQLREGMGMKAENFNDFYINELYPYCKKKVGVRKFNSVAVVGCGLAAISAFDVAWNNADKIQKVGMFSTDFSYPNSSDSSLSVFNYVTSSRKRPHMQFWLYAGSLPDSAELKNNLLLGDILATKKTIAKDDVIFNEDKVGGNTESDWKRNFTGFLLWAFGK